MEGIEIEKVLTGAFDLIKMLNTDQINGILAFAGTFSILAGVAAYKTKQKRLENEYKIKVMEILAGREEKRLEFLMQMASKEK